MLFANIYNAMEDFLDAIINGDAPTIGNILNSLYANSTEGSVQIGNTTVTWNPTQIDNATYQNTTLGQLSEGQTYALLFAVFGKIFDSYSIEPPPEYETLVDGLVDQTAPDQQEVNIFLSYLFNQFLVSAQSYLASCVISTVWLSNGRDLT